MTTVKSLDSKAAKAVSAEAVSALDASLRGGVYLDGSPEYEEARLIWNAMVDRKPGMVIRARGASDVRNAVNFARDNGLLMSVRSGGHQIAGI